MCDKTVNNLINCEVILNNDYLTKQFQNIRFEFFRSVCEGSTAYTIQWYITKDNFEFNNIDLDQCKLEKVTKLTLKFSNGTNVFYQKTIDITHMAWTPLMDLDMYTNKCEFVMVELLLK